MPSIDDLRWQWQQRTIQKVAISMCVVDEFEQTDHYDLTNENEMYGVLRSRSKYIQKQRCPHLTGQMSQGTVESAVKPVVACLLEHIVKNS